MCATLNTVQPDDFLSQPTSVLLSSRRSLWGDVAPADCLGSSVWPDICASLCWTGGSPGVPAVPGLSSGGLSPGVATGVYALLPSFVAVDVG